MMVSVHFLLFVLLILLLTVSGPNIKPLGERAHVYLSNLYVRALIVFAVLYISNRNLIASAVVAILALAILMYHKLPTQPEAFQNYGTPLAQCGGYDPTQAKRVGTIFYPLNDNPVQQKLRNQGLANVLEEPSGDFAFNQ